MRLGINFTPSHESPEQWAEILAEKGYRATCFPVNYRASVKDIDAYVKAAKERDIRIAEVGIWNSPHHPDKECARKAREYCLEQFKLADYVQADCCVNVSGAPGPEWAFCYAENYSEELYHENVEFIRNLCDTVKPQYTSYSLEPMQWMLPWSVEQYARFLKDVDREHCKVHMDIWNLVNNPYLYTHQEELIQNAMDVLGKDIVSCHIKDIRLELGTTVAIKEVPIGTGEGKIAYYLQQINKLSPDMPVLIEHLNTFEEYNTAFDYLTRLMKTMDEMGGRTKT